jgi:hypothetical protein
MLVALSEKALGTSTDCAKFFEEKRRGRGALGASRVDFSAQRPPERW